MDYKQSPLFNRTYDLIRWLLPLTTKFPRQQRFVLAAALQRTVLAFQERLIEAVYADSPKTVLRQADIQLIKLRFYLRLCHDLQLMNTGQYEHVSRLVDEVGRLLGAWIKKACNPD